MADPTLFNRVRVSTATAGQGTVTFGAAAAANMLTPAEAGATDGVETIYLLEEGTDFEIGRGAVGGGVTTITRASVIVSKISGSVGSAKMELAGTAQLRFIEDASLINEIIGRSGYQRFLLEVIKTANYTLAATDSGKVMTFNSVSGVTAALPAVANSQGEVYVIRNINSGVVTIDPNASEQIEGASTLTIANGSSARIWANEGKTAWRATVSPRSALAIDGANVGSKTAFNTAVGAISFAGAQTLSDVEKGQGAANGGFLSTDVDQTGDISPEQQEQGRANAGLATATASDKGSFRALIGAVGNLHKITEISESGTHVYSDDTSLVLIFMCGGGGAGCGHVPIDASHTFVAGGGGAGGCGFALFARPASGEATIVLGAGATGTTAASNGATGGSTTYDDGENAYTATGGSGGQITTYSQYQTASPGGQAGTVSGGLIALSATSGGAAYGEGRGSTDLTNLVAGFSGQGGSSLFGRGGAAIAGRAAGSVIEIGGDAGVGGGGSSAVIAGTGVSGNARRGGHGGRGGMLIVEFK